MICSRALGCWPACWGTPVSYTHLDVYKRQVLETGRVVMDGTGAELLTNERVRNAYLGG